MSRRQLAHWISLIGHPFVLAVVAVVVGARRAGGGAQTGRGLALVAVVIAPLALLMARQVRSGRWGNADASNPAERPLLFAVGLAATVGLVAWLLVRDPQSFLIRGLVVMAALILAAALLIRWIKLSLHTAVATTIAVGLALLGSAAGYVLVAFLPLLAWSRLALGRHTPSEVGAGFVLGLLAGLALALA